MSASRMLLVTTSSHLSKPYSRCRAMTQALRKASALSMLAICTALGRRPRCFRSPLAKGHGCIPSTGPTSSLLRRCSTRVKSASTELESVEERLEG